MRVLDRGASIQAVIPGRCEASNPESRDSPMRNCASEVWSLGPSRNDGGWIGSSLPPSLGSPFVVPAKAGTHNHKCLLMRSLWPQLGVTTNVDGYGSRISARY